MSVIAEQDDQPLPVVKADTEASPTLKRSRLRSLVSWLTHPLNLFLALLSLLPILFVLLYIAAKGSNTPYLDQWENNVAIALHTANGTLSLNDLVRQNFDHRLFFANIITMILTLTSHWNITLEMFLTVVLVCVNLILLLLLFKRDEPDSIALVVVPFSALLFSLRQHSVWLWTILIGIPMAVMFMLLGLWVMQRSKIGWRPFAVVALCAVSMTFTQLQGLVGWPLLIGALWLRGYRRPTYLVVWGIAAAITLGFYFLYQYDASLLGANEQGNSAGLVRDPYKLVSYAITYLGNPFVPEAGTFAGISAVLGLVGLIVFTLNLLFVWSKSRQISSVATWMVVGGFGVGSAVLTALGRAHVFPDLFPVQPLLDRYVTPPTMFWIAIVALGLIVIRQTMRSVQPSGVAVALMRVNVVLFCVMTGFYLFSTNGATNDNRAVSVEQEACVVNYPTSRNSNCLDYLYLKQTSVADVMDRIDQMSIYRLAGFAEREPTFDQIIKLYRLERHLVDEQTHTGFEFFNYTPTYEAVTFSQYAPSQVEFELDVPQVEHRVDLATGVYVDRSTLETSNLPQDGVIFRVGVREVDGTAHLLEEVTFDPNVDTRVIPVTVSLDAYKGQSIRLILQTSIRDNDNFDHSMWVDPVVIMRRD
jgi:hypothetical protein